MASSTFEVLVLEFGKGLSPTTRFEFTEIIDRYLDCINQLEGLPVNTNSGGEISVIIPRRMWESIHDSFLRCSPSKYEALKTDIMIWGKQMVFKNEFVTVTEITSQHWALTLRYLFCGHVPCYLFYPLEDMTDGMLRTKLEGKICTRGDGARMIFETIDYLTKEFDRLSKTLLAAKLEMQELKQELEEAKHKLEQPSTRQSKSAQLNATIAAIQASQTETQLSKVRAEKDAAVSDLASKNLLISRFNAAPNNSGSQHSEYDKIIDSQKDRYTKVVEAHEIEMQKKNKELKDLKNQLAKLRETDTAMGKQSMTDQGKASKNNHFMKEQISKIQKENEELRSEFTTLKIEKDELQVFKDSINFPNQDEMDAMRRKVEDLQERLKVAHEKSRGDDAAKKYAIEEAVKDGLKLVKEDLRKKDDKIQELRDGISDVETATKKASEVMMAASEK